MLFLPSTWAAVPGMGHGTDGECPCEEERGAPCSVVIWLFGCSLSPSLLFIQQISLITTERIEQSGAYDSELWTRTGSTQTSCITSGMFHPLN